MRYLAALLVLLPLAAGGQPLMRCSGDCGPTAVTWALQHAGVSITQDQVEAEWDWQHYHRIGIAEDLQDSPAAAKIVVLRHTRYVPRTPDDILAGKCAPDRTILLVHGRGFAASLLNQHWITMAGFDPSTGISRWHWGDGSIRDFSPDTLRGWYSGPPRCCYEVLPVGGTGKATIWNSLWDKLMRRFF